VLLLAFDTATPAIAVALHDGSRVLAAESVVDARRHGELLAAGIDKVLRAAGASRGDLTGLAVGTGPGPYTGLRAGVMTANVLASALDLPVHGVCSLDVIAADAGAPGDFLVATDARRREVYWARYGGKGMRRAGPLVSRPAELPAGDQVAGEGPVLYPELGTQLNPRYPSAARLAELAVARGPAVRAGLAEPIYLRRPDARQPGPRKRVTAARETGPR
jgi:tRNA threonylcarbamoyladenosine biosynthesis protein TsaB